MNNIQDNLRQQVKLLKALQNTTYKSIAEDLEISQDSFYSWLKGHYNFGKEKTDRLNEIIWLIKEV